MFSNRMRPCTCSLSEWGPIHGVRNPKPTERRRLTKCGSGSHGANDLNHKSAIGLHAYRLPRFGLQGHSRGNVRGNVCGNVRSNVRGNVRGNIRGNGRGNDRTVATPKPKSAHRNGVGVLQFSHTLLQFSHTLQQIGKLFFLAPPRLFGKLAQSPKTIQHIYDTVEHGRVSLSQACMCDVIVYLHYQRQISH